MHSKFKAKEACLLLRLRWSETSPSRLTLRRKDHSSVFRFLLRITGNRHSSGTLKVTQLLLSKMDCLLRSRFTADLLAGSRWNALNLRNNLVTDIIGNNSLGRNMGWRCHYRRSLRRKRKEELRI